MLHPIGSAEMLLHVLSNEGEMSVQTFLSHVPRSKGDYTDFYVAAGLLHAGYVSTDPTVDSGSEKVIGKLGFNTRETAALLFQLVLPPGETFQFNGTPRSSWNEVEIKVFITAEGHLRLDELEQRQVDRRRKRNDYLMSLAVALIAALASSSLTDYCANRRQQERTAAPRASTSAIVAPVGRSASSILAR